MQKFKNLFSPKGRSLLGTFLAFGLLANLLSACGGEEVTPSPTPNNTISPTAEVTKVPTLTPRPTFAPTVTPFPTLKPDAPEEARILATIAVSNSQPQIANTPVANRNNGKPNQPQVVEIGQDKYRPKIEFTELPPLDDGVPTLINFDSVWCAFCREVAPVFNNLKTRFSQQVKFANLNINSSSTTSIAARYSIANAPAIILVDKKGVGRYRWLGFIKSSEIEEAIKEILAQP